MSINLTHTRSASMTIPLPNSSRPPLQHSQSAPLLLSSPLVNLPAAPPRSHGGHQNSRESFVSMQAGSSLQRSQNAPPFPSYDLASLEAQSTPTPRNLDRVREVSWRIQPLLPPLLLGGVVSLIFGLSGKNTQVIIAGGTVIPIFLLIFLAAKKPRNK